MSSRPDKRVNRRQTPESQNVDETTRELQKLRQELNSFKEKTEWDIERMRRELNNSKETIEELNHFREKTEKDIEALWKKLKNSKQTPEERKLRRAKTEQNKDSRINLKNPIQTSEQREPCRGSNEREKGARVDNKTIKDGEQFPSIPPSNSPTRSRGSSRWYDGDDHHSDTSSRDCQSRRSGCSSRGSQVSFDGDDHFSDTPTRDCPSRGSGCSSRGSQASFDNYDHIPCPPPRVGPNRRSGCDSRGSEVISESFEIKENPTKYYKRVEGSRMVFKCVTFGNNDPIYQWLKDGTEIQDENDIVLVLEKVKVCDFGWYSCKVRRGDVQQESFPEELDVSPCEGRRYRYLNEAFENFPDIQQNVEKLLVRKVAGNELLRQVALEWGMDSVNREFLQSASSAAGKDVISHLKAKYPELSVYAFCKFLKKPEIRRLDIVKELRDHLVSVPK